MIVEIEEECSQFAPGARWVHGGEYYAIDYRAEVPDDIPEDDIDDYLEAHPECITREDDAKETR